MQINFSPDEYRRLCLIADYYGTTPAWLVRRYVEEKASFDELLISRLVGGVGIEGGEGLSAHHPDSPPPALKRGYVEHFAQLRRKLLRHGKKAST